MLASPDTDLCCYKGTILNARAAESHTHRDLNHEFMNTELEPWGIITSWGHPAQIQPQTLPAVMNQHVDFQIIIVVMMIILFMIQYWE